MNRRKAIKARCLDCSGGEIADVWNCKCPDCKLYPYRAECKMPSGRLSIAKIIKEYCQWSQQSAKGQKLCTEPYCAFNKIGRLKRVFKGKIEKSSIAPCSGVSQSTKSVFSAPEGGSREN
ncbi:MAG TPA: hypothetical protein DD381_05460 [Lentisphaeria bacterium]|nr:MAG: hypothetical protein A2X47_07000 [Lentisphaerae bacterium GWF2_38_69]HBM15778.1 hypothetical protein [Lentisphaeria bacterium]